MGIIINQYKDPLKKKIPKSVDPQKSTSSQNPGQRPSGLVENYDIQDAG